MRLRVPSEAPESPFLRPVLLFGLIAAAIVGYRACSRDAALSDAPSTADDNPTESPSASAASPSSPALDPTASKPLQPRCVEVSREPYVIGEPPRNRPKLEPTDDAGATPADGEDEPLFDELSPFAVEVGRGTLYEGGFAVGALRDAEGGTVATVATVGFDGQGGKLVRLARSRGDMDPPVVAGHGKSVLAAMFEPNAGGRAIKLVKVEGDQVTWGPELSEGRDESMAVDLATSGSRATVVWDDVSADGKRSSIQLASFDPVTMRETTPARPVSPPSLDAESPRLVSRPGGYWLAYLASGGSNVEGGKNKKKTKAKSDEEIDEDTKAPGESIDARWLEIMPLDERGTAASMPRAVTPKDGHVLAFDIESSGDGELLVAYRDDDTPSGSGGGRVYGVVVKLGGVEPASLLTEDAVGVGVPDLLPGWLAVPDLRGATRLAPIDAKGALLGALAGEPVLGNGEPLAATQQVILLGRPAGKAMKLSVVRCSASEGADAGTADGGEVPK